MTAAAKTPKPKTSTKSASSSKTTKPKVVKSKSVPKTPVPVPVPVVVEEVQNEEVTEVVTIENSMTDVLGRFSESIQSLTLALAKLKSDFKTLEKQVLKEARTMDKVNARRNRNKGARAPS